VVPVGDEWTFDIGPHYVGASRGGHTRVGLVFDEDGDLEVDLETGSAYMREHQTVVIPLAVLRKLIEGRGGAVVSPSRSEEP
jgi:hypothetical protein